MLKSELEEKKEKVGRLIKKNNLKSISYMELVILMGKDKILNEKLDVKYTQSIGNSHNYIYSFNPEVVTIFHEITGYLIFDKDDYDKAPSINGLRYKNNDKKINVSDDINHKYPISQSYFDKLNSMDSWTNKLNRNRIWLEILGFIITVSLTYYLSTINCK